LKLISAGERVASFPFDGYWMDLGRIDDYEQAVTDFERLKPQFLGEISNEGTLPTQVAAQIHLSL
jgi:NDP-sugar pyrophosphorylase family protein